MTKYKLGYIVIFCVFISVFLSGCYSYREVTREDYFTKEKHNTTKVILNNKEEVIIEEYDNINVMLENENIVFISDTSKTVIPVSDVNRIMEEKFDFGKTILGTFWLSIVAFLLLGLVLYISGGFPTFQ
jgi:hypothetical protein